MSREQQINAIIALPTDAQRFDAYIAMHRAEVLAPSQRVVMCWCEDWLNCAHPYPRILTFSGQKMTPSHRVGTGIY